MLALSPLPTPTWTPPPVVADPFGDALEVVAAVLAMGCGVVVYLGSTVTPAIHKRAFSSAWRLADFRRRQPDKVFGIRLGVGGRGVVAVEIITTSDGWQPIKGLRSLPRTVTLAEGSRRWCVYQLPQGFTSPAGRVCLGDGIALLASGRGTRRSDDHDPARAWAEAACSSCLGSVNNAHT